MFKTRVMLRRKEEKYGIDRFSEVEKSIFSFIDWHENATITLIHRNNYFKSLSLSTIKRAVNSLERSGLVSKKVSKLDGRSNYLQTHDIKI
jgi:DNA-binding MarR family transcriptional regulator